jgi:uncharacterized protein YgbK (DUF1537 family)
MSHPLISFYGDDFTGSTDAMESLARRGIRTVLFTAPPSTDQLARRGNPHAFGIAGMTRSMPPDEMERTLRPAFQAMRETGAAIVHYKVCSTFDSSPSVGSVGRAIDVGIDVFGATIVPVVVGAPALGRYCVFGNLFARCGAESEPFRLDRHPSMSNHPTTPMDEADLRVHLAKQTKQAIGLIDVLTLEDGDIAEECRRVAADGARVVLIDALSEQHLATIGQFLQWETRQQRPLFVVGSSSIEASLAANVGGEPTRFARPASAVPIVVVCGSRSPVADGQIRWALSNGFVEVSDLNSAVAPAASAIRNGTSVVIHSRDVTPRAATSIGPTLGRTLRDLLGSTKVRRVIVAGGDTSGAVAQALGIESMEMIAELTRGSPLVRVSAPGSPADGLEMTFKGGQIGGVDFFGAVAAGKRAPLR